MEDVQLDRILWMLAHKSATHVGRLKLSNGQLPTAVDVKCNDVVDTHAKQTAEEHRAPASEVKVWKDLDQAVMETAKWIGRVIALACNIETVSFNDNEAAMWNIEKPKRLKLVQKLVRSRRLHQGKTPSKAATARK